MDKLASSYVIDILKEEMNIADGRIWIRDQNVVIPKDDDLFFAVGMIYTDVISARNTFVESDSNNLLERQIIQAREDIQIDIHSRNTDAITRRWEILAALRSVYSQQVQEAASFKIFAIPSSFVNASETEGAEKINKFSITIAAHVWYVKEKAISEVNGDYYESFDTRVDDEATIEQADGLFEFNIEGETIT